MNNIQLFDIIRPIILSVTGVPECILADPNAPAPTGEYAAVRPKQSITERGQANIIRTNGTGNELDVDVRAQIIAECSVNFYRGNAVDYAERLKQCNKRPDISEALFRAKLGWNRTSAVNNLTTLQSNNQEQRAQISIFLMYETTDEVTINSIERASFDVQYETGVIVASGSVETIDAP